MKKVLKLIIVIVITSIALTTGVLVAGFIIYKDTEKGIMEQFKVMVNTGIEREQAKANNEIPLGCIGVKYINKDIEREKSITIIDLSNIKAEDLVPYNKRIKTEKIEYPENNLEYSLKDFYDTDEMVEPYDVVYHIENENSKNTVSLILANISEEKVLAQKLKVIAFGVDSKSGYYAFNNITVGTDKTYVHATFNGRLNNVNSEDNKETYIDENNNFIYLIYENDRVISFMVGNTLGEKVILDTITQ